MRKEAVFYKKNFLIYGFGKSGFASYKFLRKKNDCKIIDDNRKNIPIKYKHKTINYKQLKKNNFDYIVLSPGIDLNRCKLSKYLKNNISRVITELDIFYLCYPKIKKITITGTNGKSTTSKLLYDVLKEHRKDVRLTGNIGNPTLLEKGVKNNTLFVIEASSYQLEYSKYYRSEYSIILNLTNDHLERHGNFKNYVKAKFKLMQNQSKNNYAFIEKKNNLFNNLIKKNKIKSKIFRVNYEEYQKYYKLISNNYFKNKCNIKNLSFIFALSKNLKLSYKKIIKVTNKFKGLDFRQQIIYESKKLTIINDSKSTSLSATLPLLESFKNIYWILGGLAKKGDQLKLEKRYFGKIKAFIYGKDKVFFSKILSNKIKYKISKNLNYSLLLVFKDLRKRAEEKKIILFSPSAASFDQFNDFEDRGKCFNKIIKNYLKK
jgi:UDP-N-acetylmuramoylalanine--D-glutamate ligase